MDNGLGAYIVACGTMLKGETNAEYAARAAGPAEEAGLKVIAGGLLGTNVEVLEGDLPQGTQFMAIEHFPSMDALKRFWHSEGYQSAIRFRRESVKMHFIVALDGQSPEEVSAELREAKKRSI